MRTLRVCSAGAKFRRRFRIEPGLGASAHINAFSASEGRDWGSDGKESRRRMEPATPPTPKLPIYYPASPETESIHFYHCLSKIPIMNFSGSSLKPDAKCDRILEDPTETFQPDYVTLHQDYNIPIRPKKDRPSMPQIAGHPNRRSSARRYEEGAEGDEARQGR